MEISVIMALIALGAIAYGFIVTCVCVGSNKPSKLPCNTIRRLNSFLDNQENRFLNYSTNKKEEFYQNLDKYKSGYVFYTEGKTEYLGKILSLEIKDFHGEDHLYIHCLWTLEREKLGLNNQVWIQKEMHGIRWDKKTYWNYIDFKGAGDIENAFFRQGFGRCLIVLSGYGLFIFYEQGELPDNFWGELSPVDSERY